MSPSNPKSGAPASKATDFAPYAMTAEEAALAIGGMSRSGSSWRGRCPACGRSDTFSISPGRHYNFTFQCFAGCTYAEMSAALAAYNVTRHRTSPRTGSQPRGRGFSDLALDEDAAGAYIAERRAEEAEKSEPNPKVLRLLDRSMPAKGTIVETYLRSRGITIPIPDTIRYLPDYLKHPAMLAVGHIVGYWAPVMASVTRLKPDGSGKALLPNARTCVGRWVHGPHIELIDDGEGPLAIGEGIETCLAAVQLRLAKNVWTCYCADNLRRKFVFPENREILLLGENDRAGASAKAIRAVKARLKDAGVVVRSCFPKDKGYCDANDVLMNKRSPWSLQ